MNRSEKAFIYVLLVFAIAAAAVGFAGQPVSAQLNIFGSSRATPSPSPEASASPTPTPTPIPLAAVIPESELVMRRLDQIKRTTLSESTVRETRRSFENRQRNFESSFVSAREELGGIPSLKTISKIESAWKSHASTVSNMQSDLREFSTELGDVDKEIAEMARKWTDLRQSVQAVDRGSLPPKAESAPKAGAVQEAGEAEQKEADNEQRAEPSPTPVPDAGFTVREIPPAIRLKIDQTIAEIDRAQSSVAEMRTDLLTLQADISGHEERIDEILSLAEEERKSALSNLFSRDTPAIWDPASRAGDRQQGLQGGFTAKLDEAREHLLEIIFGIPFLLILSLIPLFILIRARRKTRRILEQEPGLERQLVFFSSPYASWSLLTILWITSTIGRNTEIVDVILSLTVLIPGYYLLRRVAEDSLLQIVNVLVVFFVFDTVLPLFEGFPFLYRLLFAFEMLAGIGLVLWLRRREPPAGILDRHGNFVGFLRKLAFLSAVPFAIALLADLFGYLSLARVISRGLLGSAYLAVVHYVVYLALVSLTVLLLRAWPLAKLKMMRDHTPLVLRKVSIFLGVVLVVSWISNALEQFFIAESAGDAITKLLDFSFTLGSFSIKVSDLLVFIFVVWLAFALSKFVRFILEEDVYSRVSTPDGVSYAASTILHYVILFGGFTLAVLSLGIDLTRFTILAGAFGVGLGFGLQNIVENFVSGVILLFERPVTVGDVIQRGQQTGDLKRIGLRASVLGTPEGAEVIVPNGVLLSEELTNWTPATHHRRLDVDVGVAYGSDPEQVMALLVECARSHPEVQNDPEPVSLFVGFGDSALNFQVRSWADSESQWWKIRSDITVAVYKALNEADIEIPFPQRDLNLKTAEPESVMRLIRKKHEDRPEEKE